ncbi:unnamed protein product [Sphagnum compactum]
MAMGCSSSLVNALDLVCSYEGEGASCSLTSPSCGLGWLSPRISFSTGFVDNNAAGVTEGAEVPGREELWREDLGADFEFCMAFSSVDHRLPGGGSSAFKPADELFHKGKLRPLSLPSRNQLDSMQMQEHPPPQAMASVTNVPLLERTILSTTSRTSTTSESTSSCPVLQSSENSGVPKSPRWREVFGLLRRARSDGGRYHQEQQSSQKRQSSTTSSSLRCIFKRPPAEHPVVDTSLLQSKKLPVREAPENLPYYHVPFSSAPPAALEPFAPDRSPVQLQSPAVLSALLVASPIHPTTLAAEVGMKSEEKLLPQAVPSNPRLLPRHKSLGVEGYTNGILNMDSSIEGGEFRNLGHGSGRVVMRKLDNNRGGVDEFPQSTTTVISPSAQIVLRNLERCSMASGGKHHTAHGPKPQDNNHQHLRALRTREIRRSSEGFSSYSSNVRVTPVLNVPQVCIGPAIRSSASSKGHLAKLRSLFFKKNKADCRPPLTPRKIGA